MGQKLLGKRHPAGTGLQEGLGKLPGLILEPFRVHFGHQNRSEKGSQNELDFRTVFKRLLGATTPCGAGSAGLEPDPREG